jgi:hypothetical protein
LKGDADFVLLNRDFASALAQLSKLVDFGNGGFGEMQIPHCGRQIFKLAFLLKRRQKATREVQRERERGEREERERERER